MSKPTTTFRVERHIPVPPGAGRGKASLYPFPTMKVGDSFVVENLQIFRSASRAAHMYGKRHGQKFCESLANLRIWRVR